MSTARTWKFTVSGEEAGCPLDEFLPLAGQILIGLHDLDEKGVIHLDIKPQNVMRTMAGEIKITDYGIARNLRETAQSGKPDLPAAPFSVWPRNSLCRRGTGPAGGRVRGGDAVLPFADGRVPFHRGAPGTPSPQVVRQWHCDPRHRVSMGHAVLDRVLARSLAVFPNGRYANCMELKQDLDRLADERGRRGGRELGAVPLPRPRAITPPAPILPKSKLFGLAEEDFDRGSPWDVGSKPAGEFVGGGQSAARPAERHRQMARGR